jgi:hypothetical protein
VVRLSVDDTVVARLDRYGVDYDHRDYSAAFAEHCRSAAIA